jgi:hypothetical protein
MTNSRPGSRAWEATTPLYVMMIFLVFGCLSCGCAPRPFITSVSPDSATAGSSQFLLTVNATTFAVILS